SITAVLQPGSVAPKRMLLRVTWLTANGLAPILPARARPGTSFTSPARPRLAPRVLRVRHGARAGGCCHRVLLRAPVARALPRARPSPERAYRARAGRRHVALPLVHAARRGRNTGDARRRQYSAPARSTARPESPSHRPLDQRPSHPSDRV